MPRRAIAAVAATIAGLALLFSFKTPHRVGARVPVAAGTGSSTASGSSTYRDGTVAGPAEDTRWGEVQVQVTVAGGRITDVTTLQTPNDNPHSLEINSEATPTLRQEVLTAQSAQIDAVSGATITSDGYIQSLQATLDEIRN